MVSKGQRCPQAGPIGLAARWRCDHVHGLDQPHPAGLKSKAHAALGVAALQLLVARVQAVHRHHQRAGQRTVLVGEEHRQLLARGQCVRIALGHQLERETQAPIALRRARRPRQHQAFGAACIQFARRGAGLLAQGALPDDAVQAFLGQVGIELFCRQLDEAGMAVVADDLHARPGHRHQPCGVVAEPA